jgi:tungstate transport system ATP-binding protein
MITLTDVAKQYGDITALKNISLEVVKGEVFSIIGPNGCGKTTLLRIMAGIEVPTKGTVIFDGEEVYGKNLIKLRRRGTMVFQKTALFNTTVFGNIAYGLKLRQFPQQEIKERVIDALDIVKLHGYEERLAKSLSGGEQQRVALARALALDTDVLFLDEPTANLDPKSVSVIEETIAWVNRERNTTVVLATHNMFQAETLGNRTMLLINGEISQIGQSKEIFTLPSTQLVDFTRVENIFSGISTMRTEGTPIVTIDNGLKIEAVQGGEGRVTLFIRPEDIILSKERIVSSARNVFMGQIAGITDLGPLVKLRVDVGREFVVQITKRSFIEMRLNIDSQVFLTFKASSVRVL